MSIVVKNKDKTFVDISLSFQPNPLTGDLTVLLNERAINNALKNIVLIAVSESIFNRNFGSTVRDYLFENIDEGSGSSIRWEVERAVKYNEPRIDVIRVLVDAFPEQNHFMVTIVYKIKGYDQEFVFNTLLEPTR